MSLSIVDIMQTALSLNPSDLHLSVGIPPICRVNGALQRLCFPPLTTQDTLDFIQFFLKPEQIGLLKKNGEIDVSITDENNRDIRMRLSAYRQRGSYSLALRILNQKIPSFEELGLDIQVMEHFCKLNHGLVLVTGATGTGKTTTITSMIDWINHNRSLHIITIEDPIEYYHRHDKSMVHQREKGSDTKDYNSALRAALRQDPDVIFVGEMRDLESISTALTAAETGHLVFSTLHTMSAGKTIDRIIDVFPANQQQQVRTQLSMVLDGIVSQQLIPSKDESGRVLANEILVMTPAISNLIRENKVAQIQNNILTGSNLGMCSMDSNLIQLAKDGKISPQNAKAYAINQEYVVKTLKADLKISDI